MKGRPKRRSKVVAQSEEDDMDSDPTDLIPPLQRRPPKKNPIPGAGFPALAHEFSAFSSRIPIAQEPVVDAHAAANKKRRFRSPSRSPKPISPRLAAIAEEQQTTLLQQIPPILDFLSPSPLISSDTHDSSSRLPISPRRSLQTIGPIRTPASKRRSFGDLLHGSRPACSTSRDPDPIEAEPKVTGGPVAYVKSFIQKIFTPPNSLPFHPALPSPIDAPPPPIDLDVGLFQEPSERQPPAPTVLDLKYPRQMDPTITIGLWEVASDVWWIQDPNTALQFVKLFRPILHIWQNNMLQLLLDTTATTEDQLPLPLYMPPTYISIHNVCEDETVKSAIRNYLRLHAVGPEVEAFLRESSVAVNFESALSLLPTTASTTTPAAARPLQTGVAVRTALLDPDDSNDSNDTKTESDDDDDGPPPAAAQPLPAHDPVASAASSIDHPEVILNLFRSITWTYEESSCRPDVTRQIVKQLEETGWKDVSLQLRNLIDGLDDDLDEQLIIEIQKFLFDRYQLPNLSQNLRALLRSWREGRLAGEEAHTEFVKLEIQRVLDMTRRSPKQHLIAMQRQLKDDEDSHPTRLALQEYMQAMFPDTAALQSALIKSSEATVQEFVERCTNEYQGLEAEQVDQLLRASLLSWSELTDDRSLLIAIRKHLFLSLPEAPPIWPPFIQGSQKGQLQQTMPELAALDALRREWGISEATDSQVRRFYDSGFRLWSSHQHPSQPLNDSWIMNAKSKAKGKSRDIEQKVQSVEEVLEKCRRQEERDIQARSELEYMLKLCRSIRQVKAQMKETMILLDQIADLGSYADPSLVNDTNEILDDQKIAYRIWKLIYPNPIPNLRPTRSDAPSPPPLYPVRPILITLVPRLHPLINLRHHQYRLPSIHYHQDLHLLHPCVNGTISLRICRMRSAIAIPVEFVPAALVNAIAALVLQTMSLVAAFPGANEILASIAELGALDAGKSRLYQRRQTPQT
ncbi:hypothetical protein C8J56DRAFT_1056078 [Mycena floridula]|nr:hypothetical protein C8J56DRAFT_1056078 [Mycena floridula]